MALAALGLKRLTVTCRAAVGLGPPVRSDPGIIVGTSLLFSTLPPPGGPAAGDLLVRVQLQEHADLSRGDPRVRPFGGIAREGERGGWFTATPAPPPLSGVSGNQPQK